MPAQRACVCSCDLSSSIAMGEIDYYVKKIKKRVRGEGGVEGGYGIVGMRINALFVHGCWFQISGAV